MTQFYIWYNCIVLHNIWQYVKAVNIHILTLFYRILLNHVLVVANDSGETFSLVSTHLKVLRKTLEKTWRKTLFSFPEC